MTPDESKTIEELQQESASITDRIADLPKQHAARVDAIHEDIGRMIERISAMPPLTQRTIAELVAPANESLSSHLRKTNHDYLVDASAIQGHEAGCFLFTISF